MAPWVRAQPPSGRSACVPVRRGGQAPVRAAPSPGPGFEPRLGGFLSGFFQPLPASVPSPRFPHLQNGGADAGGP